MKSSYDAAEMQDIQFNIDIIHFKEVRPEDTFCTTPFQSI